MIPHVTDDIDIPPTETGPRGRAWRVDLAAATMARLPGEEHATLALWIVEAAHPPHGDRDHHRRAQPGHRRIEPVGAPLRRQHAPRRLQHCEARMIETTAIDILEILTSWPCDREPFTPEHAGCRCRLASTAAREIERLRELIDDIADMDVGDVELEHREIIARCRAEQKRWTEDDE